MIVIKSSPSGEELIHALIEIEGHVDNVSGKREEDIFYIPDLLTGNGKTYCRERKEKDEAFGRNEEMNPYSISLHGPTCAAWELCLKHSL